MYFGFDGATGITRLKRSVTQTLRFIGQSRIVSPDGTVLTSAGTHEEALMVTEIEPEKARNKELNPLNNLFADRRPDMYLTLTEQ